MAALHSYLTGISAFVHTVDAGSFTAAAARMGLTKSAVGKNVVRLEERLGIRLLNRTTRSISLTTEGETYYASCLRILEELSNAEALLATQRQDVSGCLRINLPLSLGRLWIAPVLYRLARSHPRLTLNVTFSDREVDLIEEGIDMVVRVGTPGDLASLQGRLLGTQSRIFCAAPSYLDERGRPNGVDDLARHDCLVFAREGRFHQWSIPSPNGVTDVKFAAKHVIAHGEGLRDAAVAGLGVVCLPVWLIAEDLRAGRLEQILGDQPFDGEPIHLLWPSSRVLAPKARVVVEALKAQFLPVPPWESSGQPGQPRQA